MRKIFTKTNTIVFMALLTIWRGFINATLELHPDEAYYWLWSKHLALSYYDHPGMVAYFIKFTTLVSSSEFFVRLSGLVVPLILSWVMWTLAEQMFEDASVASAAVIILNALPLMMSGSLIITPDLPAFLFWSLAIYFGWQVFRTQKAGYWYLLGLSLGLSFLSKYTSVLLAPCLFLFLIATDERHWLKTIHPYLALLLSMVFSLPVIIWNQSHQWVSFKFQLHHGLNAQANAYSLSKVIEYAGGQLLVAGPLALLAGFIAGFAYMFRRDKAKLYIALTSLPVIIFFGFTSIKTVAGPNWPATAYFSFALLIPVFWMNGGIFKKVVFWVVLLSTLSLSMLATLHARFRVIPLERFSADWADTDATSWFYGWDELAAQLRKYPKTAFIISPSHQLSAEMEYYLNGDIPCHVDLNITRPSQWNFWPSPVKNGEYGIYLALKGEALPYYAAYFPNPDRIDYFTVHRGKLPFKTYRIVYGKCNLAR